MQLREPVKLHYLRLRQKVSVCLCWMFVTLSFYFGRGGIGHLEVVNVLLSAGASPNTRNKYGQTALLRASQRGDTRIGSAPIDAKAAVNTQDNVKW